MQNKINLTHLKKKRKRNFNLPLVTNKSPNLTLVTNKFPNLINKNK